MNEVIENIMTRRSVRKFREEKIEHELLTQIAEAGKAAPSGRNNQMRRFSVVQDKKLIEEAREALGDRYLNFYGADTLIFVSASKDNLHAAEDCSCAMENMMLAASSLGLGSVWINQFKGQSGEPAVREFLRKLGLPDDYSVFYVLAVGVPQSDRHWKIEKLNKIDYFL